MIKRDMFERAATVLHEEIRQQALLEAYMAEYFDVDSSELQGKYQDSSQIVLMQLLCKLVNDDGLLMDWLYDNYNHKEGILCEVDTPCGKTLELVMKAPKDLYDYFLFANAEKTKNCTICRGTCKKYGLECMKQRC